MMAKWNRDRMLGMGELVQAMTNVAYEDNSYPPHNINEQNKNYTIELALAGWESKNISVSVENSKLTITGRWSAAKPDSMYHQGISSKNFSKGFILSPHHTVESAILKNGLLVIEIKHVLPEELKPKNIPIQVK